MKETVLIALLTYSDSVNVSFLWWIDNIRALNNDPDHPRIYEIAYIPGYRPVAFARNVAVTQFLQHPTATKLWFIDDDLVPTEESLKIFDSSADIVSGLYYLLLMENGTPKTSTAIYTKNNDGFDQIDVKNRMVGQDIVPIDAAGTGTLLIDKKVFLHQNMKLTDEYLSAEGKKVKLTEDEPLPYFRTLFKANGCEERSEDIDFVWRAKQAGFRCEAVLDAKFLHKKETLIDWFI